MTVDSKALASVRALAAYDANEQSPLLSNPPKHSTAPQQVISDEDIDQKQSTTPISCPDGNDVDDQATDEGPGSYTTAQAWAILFPSLLGSIFTAGDQTLFVTVSNTVASELNIYTSFSWVISSYMIAVAATQPVAGRLTDIYGRRAGLDVACIFFAIGTLICGLAKSLPVLVLGRVIAGIGGGSYQVCLAVIMGDVLTLRNRAYALGYVNVAWGLSMGLGGAYGGFISDWIGWRWAFLLQVPVIVLIGILNVIFVKIPIKTADTSKLKQIDWLGLVTIVSGVVIGLIGLDSSGTRVAWTHPLVLTTIPTAVFLLFLFVYVESNTKVPPILPVRILAQRTAVISLALLVINAGFFMTLMFYMPVWLETVQGMTASDTGKRLIVLSAGIGLGALASGWIIRRTGRYYWVVQVIQSAKAIQMALVAWFFSKDYVPLSFSYAISFPMGYFMSAATSTLLVPLIAATGQENQATVTSAAYLARSVGSALGVTLSDVTFQASFRKMLWERFETFPDAADMIPKIMDDLRLIARLRPEWRVGALTAFKLSMDRVWLLALVLTVVAFLAGLFMQEFRLKK